MIKNWADKETRRLFEGKRSKIPPPVRERALTKLQTLHSAPSLETLSKIPGNRLESHRGDREGQYSMRINIQYRICFRWDSGNAYDVKVTDYHE